MPDAPRTCEHCRWWDRENKGNLGPAVVNFAWNDEIEYWYEPDESDPVPFPLRLCLSPLLTFYERPLVPNGAVVADGSGYFGALGTGPQFGCVNWEAIDGGG